MNHVKEDVLIKHLEKEFKLYVVRDVNTRGVPNQGYITIMDVISINPVSNNEITIEFIENKIYSGNTILQKLEVAAKKSGIRFINLVDLSSIDFQYGDKMYVFPTFIFNIMAEGQSWYNKHGYLSTEPISDQMTVKELNNKLRDMPLYEVLDQIYLNEVHDDVILLKFDIAFKDVNVNISKIRFAIQVILNGIEQVLDISIMDQCSDVFSQMKLKLREDNDEGTLFVLMLLSLIFETRILYDQNLRKQIV